MWEDVRNSGGEMGWVLTALKKGTGIWVTDGSYMQEEREDVCGAGWLFLRLETGHKLAGSFYEESAQASSYCRERLGLLAIHLLLAAITDVFDITIGMTKICCDNEVGLYASSKRSQRVTASQADINRVARQIVKMLPTGIQYEWVASHQEEKKSWQELSKEEQLICKCDCTAKATIKRSLGLPLRKQMEQLLPLEPSALEAQKQADK